MSDSNMSSSCHPAPISPIRFSSSANLLLTIIKSVSVSDSLSWKVFLLPWQSSFFPPPPWSWLQLPHTFLPLIYSLHLKIAFLTEHESRTCICWVWLRGLTKLDKTKRLRISWVSFIPLFLLLPPADLCWLGKFHTVVVLNGTLGGRFPLGNQTGIDRDMLRNTLHHSCPLKHYCFIMHCVTL